VLTANFRPAEQSDCRWLWQLREHPSVAMQSLNPTPIPYQQHCRWYRQLMRDEHRHLDIFVDAATGNKLGFIRAEPYEHGQILSWAVEPNFQGQGIGTLMLRAWCEGARTTLWAQIKSGNAASEAVAARVGFIKVEEQADVDVWRKDLMHK
jgi:UDP-2,4-diacetamido-2,4,6-trideoxy-beta-L-altropyranose hydrolase